MLVQIVGKQTVNTKDGRVMYIYHSAHSANSNQNCIGGVVESFWSSVDLSVTPGHAYEAFFEPGYNGRANLVKLEEREK